MDKKTVEKAIKKTVCVTEKATKIGIGVGLLLLNVAATTLGALVCVITSQD